MEWWARGSTGCQSAKGRIRSGEPVAFGGLPNACGQTRNISQHVPANCGELQANGACSAETQFASAVLQREFAPYESFPANFSCAHHIRPGAKREAPFHFRRHD